MSSSPKVPYYLATAIDEAFSPDPHLGRADPRTVEAVARLVMAMAAVSKARRPSLAHEPWTAKPEASHLEHAFQHTEAALVGVEARKPELYLDHETRLPNPAHAALRLAFAMARRAEGVPG